jgi:prevent-host-death family protein
MPSTLSIREVRDRLADVVDRAVVDHLPTIITRRGKRAAAVVPVEMLDEYERLAKAEDLRMIDEAMVRIRAGEPTVPIEEVIAETLARPE